MNPVNISTKKIGIIGPNSKMCSVELYDFGVQLGNKIATKNRTIVCGGLGGFMEAVCKGVKLSPNTFMGQTIGILPGEISSSANQYIDTAIPTGEGIGRNIIIVRTADIIIAAGGGAGTLSEIALAWQLEKKVLCVTLFDGWAKELAGKNLDHRQSGLLIPVDSIEEILEHLDHG
ncbi:MAG: TIGR00725 family protein [Bacteroidetes bacterium]|nr:TIGR00725 family protein [Bacteroidota bacterium]